MNFNKSAIFTGMCAVCIMIAMLFILKHKVLGLAKANEKLNNDILKVKEAIHILNAEWAFLTQPNKLSKYALPLGLQPMTGMVIKHVDLNQMLKPQQEVPQ